MAHETQNGKMGGGGGGVRTEKGRDLEIDTPLSLLVFGS